jgi:predicted nucleic acid-binding protein
LILIDTTTAVDFLKGDSQTVARLDSIQYQGDQIGISTVSLFELLHPLRHRKLLEQEMKVRSFVHQLTLLSLDSEAASESADIMGSLMRIGEPVNALDVLIAGTALANGVERVISNDVDFERISNISDLKIEAIRKK